MSTNVFTSVSRCRPSIQLCLFLWLVSTVRGLLVTDRRAWEHLSDIHVGQWVSLGSAWAGQREWISVRIRRSRAARHTWTDYPFQSHVFFSLFQFIYSLVNSFYSFGFYLLLGHWFIGILIVFLVIFILITSSFILMNLFGLFLFMISMHNCSIIKVLNIDRQKPDKLLIDFMTSLSHL